jgi:hypothetical protein
MISSLAIALLLPLSLPAQQFGQEHIQATVATFPVSIDVISLREDPLGLAPAGFSTVEMNFGSGLATYPIITRLDKDRNVLWRRLFPTTIYASQHIQTQDGGILALGYHTLTKLDPLGNLMWSRGYWEGFGSIFTELDDGSILIVAKRWPVPDATNDLGVIHVDANGAVLSMWSLDIGPGVIATPLAIASKGQEAVICGTWDNNSPPWLGGTTTFVCKISTSCDCPVWTSSYAVAFGNDYGTGIDWGDSGDVVVTGIAGDDAFFLSLDPSDGSINQAQVYEGLQLVDVIEVQSPASPDLDQRLCFVGHRPNGDVNTSTMMLTDSSGVPIANMLYNVDSDTVASSVVSCYQLQGQAADGFFAVGTVNAQKYHWIRTDTNLSTGCLEEPYLQTHAQVTIGPEPINLSTGSIDGEADLSALLSDTSYVLESLCPADDFTALCFGDSSGTPCPCGNTAAPGAGCANSTGLGAVLSGSGSPSISADSVSLSIDQGKPNQPVLFFQGLNFINSGNGNHFGDGLRCCGGSVKRLQVRFMNASGQASTTATLSTQGSTAAGSTYCNQAWYRDPLAAGGSPCLNYFNTTNALSITWTP